MTNYSLIFLALFLNLIMASRVVPNRMKNNREKIGWYANSNPQKLIMLEGAFLNDPPGGVEAIVQLSIALSYAVENPQEVVIRAPVEYHDKWTKLYNTALIRNGKHSSELKPGDIFITTEGVLCPTDIPKGVHIFVWLLADYLGCRDNGIRYLSHNQFLSNFTYEGKKIIIPKERIIHPYISIPIVERAHNIAGLERDGTILYHRSQLVTVKRNIVLTDDDIPYEVRVLVNQAAEKNSGKVINLSGLNRTELLSAYESGKIVIDWCMRGSERCPLEASLFGNIAITNFCSTGESFADFPVPSKFMFPFTVSNNGNEKFDQKLLLNKLINLFRDIFDNYWIYVPHYEPLRKSVLDHNPSNMVKEARRFLSTLYIDENHENVTSLMPWKCVGC